MTIGVLDPKTGKTRAAEDHRGPRSRCRSRSAKSARSTGASSATCGWRPSATAPTPTCAKRSKRSSAKGPKGSSSTCAPTAAACSTRRSSRASIFLPEDEVVVTTDSRTQGHAEYRTVGDNLPERPVVVLIDRNTASRRRDPHRGARRRRRRRGGRHPLLRQGRLPAGGRPLQRRRAEADDRRVLHPRRRQPRRDTRHPPGRRRRATSRGPSATRRLDRALRGPRRRGRRRTG